MADGITHQRWHDRLWGFSIICGISEALIFMFLPNYNAVLFIVFYIIFYWLGEKYISPDCDLIGMSNQDGHLIQLKKKNIILGLVGLFFLLWSLIYAWSVPKHRSIFSHGLIIGTIIRIIWYILIPLFVILNWIGSFNGWVIPNYYFEFYAEYWLNSFLLACFCSLLFSDNVHLILDLEWAKGRLYTPLSKKGK
jgi:hypothetical protein